MSNVPVNPNSAMIGDYGAGDQVALQTIWTNAAGGKYTA
jgi:hypothetical protein